MKIKTDVPQLRDFVTKSLTSQMLLSNMVKTAIYKNTRPDYRTGIFVKSSTYCFYYIGFKKSCDFL